MFRRNPTRIELKLDDLHEYEALKKEMDEKTKSKEFSVNEMSGRQSKSTEQRVGYSLASRSSVRSSLMGRME